MKTASLLTALAMIAGLVFVSGTMAADRSTRGASDVTTDYGRTTDGADRDRFATEPQDRRDMRAEETRRSHEFYGLTDPWSNLPGEAPIRQYELPAENLTYPGHRGVIYEDSAPDRR